MSEETESLHGLDEFGIPAPLLHAVGVGLKQRGIDVWGKGGEVEEWVLLANSEAFYGWVRKSKITTVHVRSVGPEASDVCRELCALLDVGDPSIVLRAGFVEVKWTSNAKFFLAHVQCQRNRAFWNDVFWRICERHAGRIRCTWGKCGHDVRRNMLTKAAQCSIFCPDGTGSSHIRSDLNSFTQEASRQVAIVNRLGMHSRPSAMFEKIASRFESDIIVEGKGRPGVVYRLLERVYRSGESAAVDGKNPMALMDMGAKLGSRFVIRACGPDAVEAVDQLAALVARGFDED